jgi:hypothetical protein
VVSDGVTAAARAHLGGQVDVVEMADPDAGESVMSLWLPAPDAGMFEVYSVSSKDGRVRSAEPGRWVGRSGRWGEAEVRWAVD